MDKVQSAGGVPPYSRAYLAPFLRLPSPLSVKAHSPATEKERPDGRISELNIFGNQNILPERSKNKGFLPPPPPPPPPFPSSPDRSTFARLDPALTGWPSMPRPSCAKVGRTIFHLATPTDSPLQPNTYSHSQQLRMDDIEKYKADAAPRYVDEIGLYRRKRGRRQEKTR